MLCHVMCYIVITMHGSKFDPWSLTTVTNHCFIPQITNLRLPREGDRLKGFGYVDFEDRESLVSAMNIADLVSILFYSLNYIHTCGLNIFAGSGIYKCGSIPTKIPTL